jgi:hypothetical protein
MRYAAETADHSKPELALVVQAERVNFVTNGLDECVCAATLDHYDLLALQLGVGLEGGLDLAVFSVAALAVLIAAEADQIIGVCPLAHRYNCCVLQSTTY